MRFLSTVKSKYASASSFKKPVTASFENETFELTDKLKEALKKHKMLDQVIELEDGEAKLTPSAAKELERVHTLKSDNTTQENFEEVETVLKEETEAVIKKVAGKKAKEFDVNVKLHVKDRYVIYDGATAVVEVSYKDDVKKFDSVHTRGEQNYKNETIDEWPLTYFWLMDEDSPLYDEAFSEGWEENEISRNLVEMLSYDERLDELRENAEKAVKDLMARNDD